MIVFLSSIYYILGLAYLIVPSIALELGRPKDLFKGGLFFLLATFLLLKKNAFNNSDLLILVLNNLICFIFILEVTLIRWNSLLDKEKNSFKNFSEIKNKFFLFFDALKLGNKNFFSKSLKSNLLKKSLGKKVWVRSERDNVDKKNYGESLNSVENNSDLTNISKEDIIIDENNP